MITGKLILVTGYFGAGKSSLVNAAIKNIKNLMYLKTIITRPMRKEERGSEEYIFATVNKYNSLRKKSKAWDHSEIAGNYYGADIEKWNVILSQGKNLICCIAPDISVINQMSALYKVRPLLVWIETELSIANKRLMRSGLAGRAARSNHHLQTEKNARKIKSKVNYIFTPQGNLKKDSVYFTEFVNGLLNTPAV